MRFVHRCQLRWADFDAYRHLNNVRFVELFQEARIAFAQTRFGDRGMFDAATVVARQEIDYLLPLEQRAGWVDASLWVTALGSASVTMATEITEPVGDPEPGGPADLDVSAPADRIVYARGTCVVVGYDIAGRRSRRFDDAERAVFSHYLES